MEIKRQFDAAKSQTDKTRIAGQLLKWASDADLAGARVEDITHDNALADWLAKNNVATGNYRATTGRIMANNGFTLGQGNLWQRAAQNKTLADHYAATDGPDAIDPLTGFPVPSAKATASAEKAQLVAAGQLQRLRERFPKIDAEIMDLQGEIRQGKQVEVKDPSTHQQTGWDWVKLSPQELAEHKQQITGLQAAKAWGAAYGQRLKAAAGEVDAPQPGAAPGTPPAGQAPPALKVAPTGANTSTDPEIRRMQNRTQRESGPGTLDVTIPGAQGGPIPKALTPHDRYMAQINAKTGQKPSQVSPAGASKPTATPRAATSYSLAEINAMPAAQRSRVVDALKATMARKNNK